jgi:hypothetical protein
VCPVDHITISAPHIRYSWITLALSPGSCQDEYTAFQWATMEPGLIKILSRNNMPCLNSWIGSLKRHGMISLASNDIRRGIAWRHDIVSGRGIPFYIIKQNNLTLFGNGSAIHSYLPDESCNPCVYHGLMLGCSDRRFLELLECSTVDTHLTEHYSM